jgi:hypothetical protein
MLYYLRNSGEASQPGNFPTVALCVGLRVRHAVKHFNQEISVPLHQHELLAIYSQREQPIFRGKSRTPTAMFGIAGTLAASPALRLINHRTGSGLAFTDISPSGKQELHLYDSGQIHLSGGTQKQDEAAKEAVRHRPSSVRGNCRSLQARSRLNDHAHLHRADLNHVAGFERLFLAGIDPLAVDVGAVGAVQVFDMHLAVFENDHRVLT